MRVWAWQAARVVLVAVLLGMLAQPSAAQTRSQKIQREREKLRSTIQERRKAESRLREVKVRQRSAAVQYHESEAKLHRAEQELRSVRARLSATEQRIRTTRAKLAQVNKRLANHMDDFWKRLEVFYKRGEAGYLEVVLGAGSFEDFVDRTTLFRSITAHDLALKHEIEDARAQQEALKADLEQTWRELENLRGQVDEKARAIQTEAERRRQVLARIRQDRAAQEQVYNDLLEAQRAIERTLYRLANPPGAVGSSNLRLSGGFIKPAAGHYTSRFGWRIHPLHGRRSFHDGIDIAGGYGTTIRAAAAGQVVSAGWHSSAYGYAVMINHGSGYVTLYGHCSSVLVREGQSVSQGQPIARMGSTGWSTGPHVHFSIYRNGRAINPLSVR